MFAMLLASVAAGAQAQTAQARFNESAAMNDAANAIAVDHTGFAVSSLDEAIWFWTGALGFILERQSEMGGDFLHQVTGVDDPGVKTAIVRAPDGYAVELLQYSRGRENGAVPSSAGAMGAAHLALTVKDIDAAIARVEAAGWKAKGSPLPIAGGKRVLFGSDQMVWPEGTAQAIARFRTAPYLSPAQRRDIFFNNAVRLFGWSDLAACGRPA